MIEFIIVVILGVCLGVGFGIYTILLIVAITHESDCTYSDPDSRDGLPMKEDQ